MSEEQASELDLDAVRERHRTASLDWHGANVDEALADIPDLIAEIVRLRSS